MHPLKNTEAQNYMAMYPWDKINYLNYYFKVFNVSYNINIESEAPRLGKMHHSIGFSNFHGFVPF